MPGIGTRRDQYEHLIARRDLCERETWFHMLGTQVHSKYTSTGRDRARQTYLVSAPERTEEGDMFAQIEAT